MKIPSIDLYCIKMNLKHFYPSPHLQNCLTSARLKFRNGSGFSGKCQTHLKNFSRQKLSSGWQYCFVFFWIFIEFYQMPDYSGKCQTKGFRLVWQMPDSSEHFFWHVHMCQTQLKNLGGNKSMFYVILNQFYECQTKLQNKNPCYLLTFV